MPLNASKKNNAYDLTPHDYIFDEKKWCKKPFPDECRTDLLCKSVPFPGQAGLPVTSAWFFLPGLPDLRPRLRQRRRTAPSPAPARHAEAAGGSQAGGLPLRVCKAALLHNPHEVAVRQNVRPGGRSFCRTAASRPSAALGCPGCPVPAASGALRQAVSPWQAARLAREPPSQALGSACSSGLAPWQAAQARFVKRYRLGKRLDSRPLRFAKRFRSPCQARLARRSLRLAKRALPGGRFAWRGDSACQGGRIRRRRLFMWV